jgi:hypothetical protein
MLLDAHIRHSIQDNERNDEINDTRSQILKLVSELSTATISQKGQNVVCIMFKKTLRTKLACDRDGNVVLVRSTASYLDKRLTRQALLLPRLTDVQTAENGTRYGPVNEAAIVICLMSPSWEASVPYDATSR